MAFSLQILQKVYQTRVTHLDDVKYRLKLEWTKAAKLDDGSRMCSRQIVRRRRLSACVEAGIGHFEHC